MAEEAMEASSSPSAFKSAGTWGLILAILALVLVFILFMLWFFIRHNDANHPRWIITYGVKSGTDDTFAPTGADMYQVHSPDLATLNIVYPKRTIVRNEQFIVDNTRNGNPLTVTSKDGSITIHDYIHDHENPNPSVIPAHSSARFTWIDPKNISRIF